MSFQNKCVLITGGGQGIGLAAAQLFIEQGARVFLVDKDQRALEAAITQLGARATYYVADVSQPSQVQNYVAEAVNIYGGIDVALLNAGIEGVVGPMEEVSYEDYERVMAVNVRGVWLGLKHLAPVMKKAGGSIVVTSSVTASRGRPYLAVYSASKHAVLGLVRSVALEWAEHNVRINAVCPASTETQMMKVIDAQGFLGDGAAGRKASLAGLPFGRYAAPVEVAQVMLFLSSEQAAYVTGAAYMVDGGATAGPTARNLHPH